MDAAPAVASLAGNAALIAVRHALSGGADTRPTYHPLTSLFWVALYSQFSEGTRLGFSQNTICLEEPGVSQKVWRTVFSSEDREQLFRLNRPVQVASYLYDPKKNEYLKTLFNTAKKGFEQLDKFYATKDWDPAKREASLLTCMGFIDNALNTDAPQVLSETQKKVISVYSDDDIITGVNLLKKNTPRSRAALIKFLEDQEQEYIKMGGNMLAGK